MLKRKHCVGITDKQNYQIPTWHPPEGTTTQRLGLWTNYNDEDLYLSS